MEPQHYDTDLTDEQFAIVEPFLPRPKKMGRPPANLRAVLNALFYLLRTGCQWRMLPHDFPPWSTVHTWYRRWRRDGTWERINESLRQQVRLRAGDAREPRPAADALDAAAAEQLQGIGCEKRELHARRACVQHQDGGVLRGCHGDVSSRGAPRAPIAA